MPVHEGKDRHFQDGINIGNVQQTSDIDDNGTGVERQQIGVFHEWQRPPTEIVAERLRHGRSVRILLANLTEELLELRGTTLL